MKAQIVPDSHGPLPGIHALLLLTTKTWMAGQARP